MGDDAVSCCKNVADADSVEPNLNIEYPDYEHSSLFIISYTSLKSGSN